MQPKQKCCLHCPESWKLTKNRKDHNCCLPDYVKENGKSRLSLSSSSSSKSSLEKYPNNIDNKTRRNFRSKSNQMIRQSSVGDRFAIARKFHTDNLQHQPLPDKVDDSVFKTNKLSKSTPDLSKNIDISLYRERKSKKINNHYGPTLGCKTPITNMDLAICWEAPINPIYEPSRPLHIDGSDGGPGPAIFALVHRENNDSKIYKSPVERFESKFNNVRSNCQCNNRIILQQNYPCNRENNDDCSDVIISKSSDDLCDNFNSLCVDDNRRVKSGSSINQRRKIQPVHLRNCEVCICKGDRTKRPKSRPIYSAPVVYQGNKNFRRNGLPTSTMVPRPRTPYAKRDFCIDTLTPPFSIVEGCRDSDYPEHWRLASVYQQSYRNPRRNPM